MTDKAKPTIVIKSRPAPKEYFAADRHGGNAYFGTLEEIFLEMEDEGNDPDDYVFYPKDKPVKVKFVKKLVLEAEEE